MPIADPLYVPDVVTPGRLSYAPDRSAFAPVLTERFPYPTEDQANEAYLRLLSGAPIAARPYPKSIWLFGCRPGALDAETARIHRSRAPVVHCATDLIGADGERLGRVTANFVYYRSVWTMHPVYPPTSLVLWRDREASPKDVWWWVPGRSRYE